MKKLLLFLSFLVGITLASMSAFAQRPAYTYATQTLFVGVPVTITPTHGGGTPTLVTAILPAGLIINATTGVITGTPITVAGAINYNISLTNGSGTQNTIIRLTITKATLTITANNVNKIYGTAITGGAGSSAFTAMGLQNGETIGSVTIAYGTGSAATSGVGTNNNTVTPSAATGGTFIAANYTIVYAQGDIIVGKAPLSITANDVNKTYGTALANGASTAFTPVGLQNGQSIGSVTMTYGTGAVAAAAVATYVNTAVPSAATGGTFSAANYTITYNQGDIIVGKAPLSITANDVNKPYGNTLINGTSTAFNKVGLQNGQTLTGVTMTYGTGAAATDAVGTYANQATPSGGTGTFTPANYTITYNQGDIIVGKTTLTITANDVNKIYGATLSGLTGSTAFTSVGLQNGQTISSVTIAYATGSAPTAAVNTYTNQVTPSAAIGSFTAANYTLVYAQGDIIVGKAPLIVTANNQTKAYGSTFTFAGTEFTKSGLLNSDAITSVTLTSAGSVATASVAGSPYSILPSAATGTGLANYTITYNNGIMTLTPVPLTITANSQTRSLGVSSTLTVTYTGLVNGNTQTNPLPTITCAATPASPVGSYPITLSGAADPNYVVTFVNGILTITAAGPNGYDWTGASNTAWNNPANWSINGTPQITVYPGSSSTGDIANIGVNFNYPNNRQPILTTTNPNSVGTLNFGENSGNAITLTVTGVTLNVAGAVTQKHNSDQTDEVTNLAGTGTLICSSFAVGDNTSQPSPTGTFNFVLLGIIQSNGAIEPSVNTTTLNSSIANLTINGNITLNSQASALGTYTEQFFGATFAHPQNYCISNPVFNLNVGVVTTNNLITATSNYVNVTTDALFGNVITNETYAMDLGAMANTLKLLGATPLTIAQGANIDFVSGGTASVSTVNYANPSGTQKVYSSVDAINSTSTVYPTLTLSDLSSKTVDGGTLSIGSNFNTSGGPVSLIANNPIVTVLSNWTNSAMVTQGAGNITISGSLTNNSGGALNLGAGILSIAGNYTNNVGGTYTQGAGTTVFNGTGAQALVDNSTTGTIFKLVTFNGSGTATMSAGTNNVNFAVSSTGVLTMGGSKTLQAGSLTYLNGAYLTLNSDANGSAAVAAIPTGATISGNVSVQRYIHGDGNLLYRNYRYLSSPIHNAAPLVLGTSYAYDLQYLSTSNQNYPITTGSTGTAGGFDQAGNPTIYLYREDRNTDNSVFSGGNFIGVSNITGTKLGYDAANNTTTIGYLPVGNGFDFFYRGTKDKLAGRTTTPITDPANYPNSTTVTQTGFLNQGNVPVNLWFNITTANSNQSTLSYTATNTTGSIGFNLVGNPYACAIDWNTAYAGNGPITRDTTAILPTIWLFNPLSKQYDTYITTSATGGIANSDSVSNIISSGQGFFVRTKKGGGKLAFSEAAKTSLSPTQSSLLMGLPAGQVAVQQLLRLKLAIDTINYDDIAIAFNSNASTVYNTQEDSKYLTGLSAPEGFASFSSDNVPLSINSLPLPQKDPLIIKLNVQATSSGALTIKKTQLDALPAIYEVWLMDKYKKDSLDLRNNANYAFTISKSDTASFGTNRFQIVIRQNQALGVHLLAFNALKVTNGVQNIWKVENEQNYTNFTLERSTDKGITYNVLDGFLSNAQGTYSYLDKNPGKFTDMYRLKIEDLDGNITYSKVVTIIYSNSGNDNITKNHISIYPNPAKGIINLTIGEDVITTTNPNLSGYQTSTMPTLAASASTPAASSQSYDIKIINIIGYVVKTATSNQPSWQDNVSALLPGTYIIQVLNHSDKSLVGKSTFVKM